MAKKKILFISNIADEKIGSFAMSSILASNNLNMEYHIASNFNASTIEQRNLDENQYNIKIHHIDFIRNPIDPKNIKALKQLVKLIKKENFDIIHCNTPVGGVCGRVAAKICSVKKVIYQAHGFHFFKGAPKINWLIYYPVERILAHLTDIIITINQEDFKIAKEFKLRKNGNVYYVPGVGIDLKNYNECSVNTLEKRRSIGLCPDDFILLSAGRLDSNKNNETIIKGLSMCNDSRIKLVICGDGDEKEMLFSLAKRLGIENQVYFLGNRNDMNELYQVMDVFVLASFREGLSRSIMEAMASGKPCIVSNIRGNVDLIAEGKGGYLFNPNDSMEFSHKVNSIIINENRNSMSKFNRKKICDFGIDNVASRLVQIYNDIIN